MTLYTTEQTIGLVEKTETKEPISLQELSFYIEKPYKTIDNWIKEGFILPVYTHTLANQHTIANSPIWEPS